MTHFLYHNQCSILIKWLVNGHHQTHFHQYFNQFNCFYRHFVSQFGHGNGFRYQNFMHYRLGWCLETMLIWLHFNLLSFAASFITCTPFIILATLTTTLSASFGFTATRLAICRFITLRWTVFFFTRWSGSSSLVSGSSGGRSTSCNQRFFLCGLGRTRLC